jgi:hypothetical protein
MPRLNRRKWTQSLLSGAATAAAGAGLNAQSSPPRPAADDLVAAAKRQLVSNREAIERVKFPMSTEPASSFKAS